MPPLNQHHDAAILAALGQASLPRSPAEIAQATGLPPGAVRRHLERLHDVGRVARPGRGLYAALGDQSAGQSLLTEIATFIRDALKARTPAADIWRAVAERWPDAGREQLAVASTAARLKPNPAAAYITAAARLDRPA